MMIKRNLSAFILQALQNFPVVYVNGPRQAGKSTLVQILSKEEWPAEYVTFDDASMLGAAEANPESFLKSYGETLILDEVQMVPELFRVLKIIVDEARWQQSNRVNGRFLLTGSANILSLPKLSDALVGRMAVFTLYPLSALEITEGSGTFLDRLMTNAFKPGKIERQHTLTDIINRATFPEIVDQESEIRHRWFESYITTIIQRDVRQIADIEKLGVLPNLLRVLASRTGNLINEADIARSINQNAVTAKNYRVLLKMMFLTFDVQPWYRNIGKRLVKSSKGYITDTSLLCHLQQLDLIQVEKKDPHIFGHILENFVASEIIKQLGASQVRAELYHYRTSDGKEVDFILEQPDGRLAAIEVKARDAVTGNDFKSLTELQSRTAKDFACGIILYRGEKIIPFGEKMWAVPVEALWQ